MWTKILQYPPTSVNLRLFYFTLHYTDTRRVSAINIGFELIVLRIRGKKLKWSVFKRLNTAFKSKMSFVSNERFLIDFPLNGAFVSLQLGCSGYRTKDLFLLRIQFYVFGFK